MKKLSKKNEAIRFAKWLMSNVTPSEKRENTYYFIPYHFPTQELDYEKLYEIYNNPIIELNGATVD